MLGGGSHEDGDIDDGEVRPKSDMLFLHRNENAI